jgi:hypothetical protein
MNSQLPTNNYGYNSQFSKQGQADPSTSHKIDMLCLAILVINILNILVRWIF